MLRNIYIKTDDVKRDKILAYVKKSNPRILNVTRLNQQIYKIVDQAKRFDEEYDYKQVYDMFTNENHTDLSILVINDGIFTDLDNIASIFLSNTFHNYYDTSSLIYYCFITNQYDDIVEEFYSYFSKLDDELLESVYAFLDNNLNASKTARELFLHRNTLNYRLNKFCFLSGVDVRTTQSASLIHSYRIRHRNRFIKNYESSKFYIY
jgi:sugar diacid utilization regulator